MTMIYALGLTLTQALLAPLSTLPAQPAAPPLAQQAPSPVTVSVVTQANGADLAYQTVVRNTGSAAVQATVTQQLPDGVRGATATDGGGVQGGSIRWAATVPSGGMVTLRSTATTSTPQQNAISSVCVVDSAGNALDCTAVTTAAASEAQQPLWRRILLWGAVLLAVGVLVGAGWWWWKRRPKREPRPARTPKAPKDRTGLAVVLSMVGLIVALGAAVLVIGPGVSSTLNRATSATGGGWSGTQKRLALGEAVSDKAVEFTMYQAQCGTGGCTVTAAVHNATGQDQQFYRSMQRLYTGPDAWVAPDNADGFWAPLAAGATKLVTMHFPLAKGQQGTRVELREGAFARGVYYDFS